MMKVVMVEQQEYDTIVVTLRVGLVMTSASVKHQQNSSDLFDRRNAKLIE
jgi:hypothetical protein